MNHKKWIVVFAILATALILTHLPVSEADAAASASDFQIEGSTLVKYRGTDDRVNVPDTVDVVGESAFENNKTVQLVVIPKSVKQLDAYVFWGCDNLEEVILGKGLTAVDEYAFANCTGLKQITIPSNIQRIDAQAFAGCTNLTDIYIPAEVTSIADDAFQGCDQVTIHADEGTVAWDYAQKLTEKRAAEPTGSSAPTTAPAQTPSATSTPSQTSAPTSQTTPVPGNVIGQTQVVGNHAFVMMSPGQETVQQGVAAPTQEPADSTESGDNRSKTVAEPANLTAETEEGAVPEWKYYRNRTIDQLDFPEGTEKIEMFGFARSSVRRVIFPESVTDIGYAAFYHCDDLEDVALPPSVVSVGPKAFDYTAWMKEFEENSTENFLISGGVLLAYKGEQTEVTVPEGVRVIADEAFLEHTEIEKIYLPSTVTHIGVNAFPETTQIVR